MRNTFTQSYTQAVHTTEARKKSAVFITSYKTNIFHDFPVSAQNLISFILKVASKNRFLKTSSYLFLSLVTSVKSFYNIYFG